MKWITTNHCHKIYKKAYIRLSLKKSKNKGLNLLLSFSGFECEETLNVSSNDHLPFWPGVQSISLSVKSLFNLLFLFSAPTQARISWTYWLMLCAPPSSHLARSAPCPSTLASMAPWLADLWTSLCLTFPTFSVSTQIFGFYC